MFNRNKCNSCKEFNRDKKAGSPKVLIGIIREVKLAVVEKVLIEIEKEKLEHSDPFELVSIEGPWNDIVLNYFECLSCKKKFKLFANTYQGNPNNGWFRTTQQG